MIRWLPAILCMAVIFYFSAQTYEQQDLRPKLHNLIPEQKVIEYFSGVDFPYSDKRISINRLGVAGFVEFFIRKSAHLTIFFLLGLSVAFAFALNAKNRVRLFIYTVVFCFLYACSDEFHQSLTGDRTPLAMDVAVDTTGAVFGVLLYIAFITVMRKRARVKSFR